jgi:phospholipase C
MRVKNLVSIFVLAVTTRIKSLLFAVALSSLVLSMGLSSSYAFNSGHDRNPPHDHKSPHDDKPATATPIKYLVVIFQEDISFDHYFGTYPNALNLKGEQRFNADSNTLSVNGLTQALLTNNPN